MSEFLICSAKQAKVLLSYMDEEDEVILTVLNKKTHIHEENKRIQKKNGEELINKAKNIFYQDNDFFGIFSLYGVLKDDNIIHNILFPQLE